MKQTADTHSHTTPKAIAFHILMLDLPCLSPLCVHKRKRKIFCKKNEMYTQPTNQSLCEDNREEKKKLIIFFLNDVLSSNMGALGLKYTFKMQYFSVILVFGL